MLCDADAAPAPLKNGQSFEDYEKYLSSTHCHSAFVAVHHSGRSTHAGMVTEQSLLLEWDRDACSRLFLQMPTHLCISPRDIHVPCR